MSAVPMTRQPEDLAYDLIAVNRSELPSADPHCKQYAEE
jgi:hypothetical protein